MPSESSSRSSPSNSAVLPERKVQVSPKHPTSSKAEITHNPKPFKTHPSKLRRRRPWTVKEDLRLKSGIEKHGEANWKLIADIVGSARTHTSKYNFGQSSSSRSFAIYKINIFLTLFPPLSSPTSLSPKMEKYPQTEAVARRNNEVR